MEAVHQAGLDTQLLVGSRNIDRMRKDIDELVSMTIGFINRCDRRSFPNAPNNFIAVCRGEYGKWLIRYYRYDPRIGFQDSLSIEYEPNAKDTTYTSLERRGAKAINTQEVYVVYSELVHLVQGVANLIPDIEKLWEPLVKASKVNF